MSTRRRASIPGCMTALALLGGALVVTVLLTVLISPLVLAALHGLGASTATADGVTIRTLQLVAIAVTIIALRRMGGGGRVAWGIPVRDRLLPRVLLGFVYGLLSLGAVCVLVYLSEVRVLRPDLSMHPGYWLRVVTGALIAAISVSLLEELWFRGGLFTLLSRLGGLSWALMGGSVLYAGAHFLDVPDGPGSEHLSSSESLGILDAAVRNIFQSKNLDSFVALLIAGITLAVVRMRQGDAAVCIGIHIGWVLTIKVFKKVTGLSGELPDLRLVGQYDSVIGWLAAACLTVMLILIWRFMRPTNSTRSGAQSVTGTPE
ncbi:MAG: membrane protease YdiL (CAAX protease family) [Gammaproteobacteria bacterium]|jgi:membrane protease YdiL (CAAX protease family)